MIRMTLLSGMLLLLCAGPARAGLLAEETPAPIREGRFSVSLSAGFSSDSFALGGGFGYFVLDGLKPGFEYVYSRETNDRFDYTLSQHNLDVYLRYYLPISPNFFPFLLGDVGWLLYSQSGAGVVDDSTDIFSVLGGAGAAFYLSEHFFVEAFGGLRHYLNPPSWSELSQDDTRFEWGLGFGASF